MYNEMYSESTCLLFCCDGWALTLFVLTPCRFLHFRKNNEHRVVFVVTDTPFNLILANIHFLRIHVNNTKFKK